MRPTIRASIDIACSIIITTNRFSFNNYATAEFYITIEYSTVNIYNKLRNIEI